MSAPTSTIDRMARNIIDGDTAAIGRISRGKYTFEISFRFRSMLRVMNNSDRSNRIHVVWPQTRNSGKGVPSVDCAFRTPPKINELRPIGAQTRTIIQIQPNELRLYNACSVRPAKYLSRRRYSQTSLMRAKTLSLLGSISHSATAASGPYDIRLLQLQRPLELGIDEALALERGTAAALRTPQRTDLLVVGVHDERKRAVHHECVFLALAANQGDADADRVAGVSEQIGGNPDHRLVVAIREHLLGVRLRRAEHQHTLAVQLERAAGTGLRTLGPETHADVGILVAPW